MVVTGYFLNEDWEYREVLLSFEPLSGIYSGSYLGKVVTCIL